MSVPSSFSQPLDGPPYSVIEPTALLLNYLDWYRNALQRKLSGLSVAQLTTASEPFGWAPLGLVQHLMWVERRWLQWGLAAQELAPEPAGGEAAEWSVLDASAADVWAAWSRQVDLSRELVGGASWDAPPSLGGRFSSAADAPPLGRILVHLLQEYARHLGQLDMMRELIDGATGE